MAVLGRLLVSSAERLDLPDLLSLDSYAGGDWKYFLKSLVGDSRPYILKGFDVIDPTNAIGTQSCSIRIADSITYYPGSSAGAFYHGLSEGDPQAVPLVPELRKNAVNYVYLTFSTFNTSLDTRAFWDPDKDGGAGGEFTQDVNTESVLEVQVNVSTGSFPANTVPVAKITVGPVVITAIEDARDLMFRLGTGGINPDPFNKYGWRSLPGVGYERTEPPTTMMAGGVNPFQGADKNILTLKEWMDAVMSKLRELGGSTYWYDDVSTFSVISDFYDATSTAYQSKGKWVHDTATPGLLTWTEDIHIKMASDLRSYVLRAGNKTLANEQVMYLPMVRNAPFNGTDEAVSWTNGQAYVNTVGGAVGLFANLTKGDYVRKVNDPITDFLRVEEFYDAVNLGGSVTTAALARSIRLSGTYLGTTAVQKSRYDKGAYVTGDVTVSNRDSAAIATLGGNFHWLAMRSDTIENVSNLVSHTLSLAISKHDGSSAKVTSAAHGLVDNDRITITGTTNFNGTYQVEVETANIFYINKTGGPFANESGSGFYGTVTTAARSTPYGFLEESATHGFKSDDTIIIAGTTNYNNNYQINVIDGTSFTIPLPSASATETAGTATLARLIIRAEGSGVDLVQGQTIDIGGSVADNIRQFIGMNSLSETHPTYSIAAGYNTLDGQANFNGLINENLTQRVSKLTAMMADKAQDKMIKLLGANYQSVRNNTNGSNQEISFNPSSTSPTMTVLMPGSTNNGTITLSGILTLAANQVAYFTVDRNNAFTLANLPALTVVNIANFILDENTFVFATRLATGTVWLWDGSSIEAGRANPTTNYLNKIDIADRTGFYRSDQTVTWTGTQLEFAADIVLEFVDEDGTLHSYTISSSNSPLVLASNQYAWIQVDRNLTSATIVPQVGLTFPAQPNAGIESFPFLKRIDADLSGSGYLHIPFHKQLLSPGQTVRFGASGSGSGTVKSTFLDPINTTLPTGSTYTSDGVATVNGDTILFTNLSANNNRVYQISGVGTSIVFTALRVFNGQFDPTDGDTVRVQKGNAFQDQLAVFDGTNFKVNDIVRHFDGVSGNFWEQSSLKTANIVNNTTANVFTVSYNGSQNMVMSYSIIRGGAKNTGQLYITTDGATAKVARSSAYIGSDGVTFNASISGSNLLLNYTSDNTGPAGTLKYHVQRWSDVVGGPTGIPSYSTGGGGGGEAGGSFEEIQFNGAGGLLDGDPRFKWNQTDATIDMNGMQIGVLSSPVTLNDNQIAASTIITYSATSYNYATIEYSATRNGQRRKGQFEVSTDGTTIDMIEEYMETSPLGLSFAASITGSNVTIKYTSTSTGFTGSLKYSIKRWT